MAPYDVGEDHPDPSPGLRDAHGTACAGVRGRKLAIYAREGVSHAWLINPASQTLEVLALAEGRWVLLAAHTGAAMVRAEPFEAVELELSALWAPGPGEPAQPV